MQKKAGNKLIALTRMANILNPFRRILFSNLSSRVNSITAHFYRGFVHAHQTIWLKKFINGLLNLTSELNGIPFNELLIINYPSVNNEVSTHNKNIQALSINVYNNLNGLSLTMMLDLFTTRENIRQGRTYVIWISCMHFGEANYSEWSFSVLIINWNYLITGMFSGNFITFCLHNVVTNGKANTYF